jgi:hypothetical protein
MRWERMAAAAASVKQGIKVALMTTPLNSATSDAALS